MPRRDARVLMSQLVPMFLLHVRSADGDVDGLIEKFGLPKDAAIQPEVPIPLHAFHAFSDAAARASGQPFLGMEIARAVPRGRYGLIEFIARSATHIRGAVESLIRYSTLLNELVRFELERGPSDAILTVRVPGESLALGRHSNEFTLTLFAGMISELSGKPFVPRRVWFAHPEPEGAATLRETFKGAAVEFERGENGLLFDAAVLDWPIVSADPALHAVLDAQAQKSAPERVTPEDFVERARDAVRRAMESGAPGIERVAPLLHMSDRTLQRRLEEHGTTFKDLVDDVRFKAARLYLEDPMIGLGEIAFRLGYSELRSFARAFKRWAGTTPGEYRTSKR